MSDCALTVPCGESERERVLAELPQVGTFRFIDQIQELSETHIKASYKFRGDEWFYSGHFPGDPVTPGVILIEAMAQAGLVALGMYILSRERPNLKLRTLFSECTVEFLNVVLPGETVHVLGERSYWRRNKLQSKITLFRESGELIAVGTFSGLGVEVQ